MVFHGFTQEGTSDDECGLFPAHQLPDRALGGAFSLEAKMLSLPLTLPVTPLCNLCHPLWLFTDPSVISIFSCTLPQIRREGGKNPGRVSGESYIFSFHYPRPLFDFLSCPILPSHSISRISSLINHEVSLFTGSCCLSSPICFCVSSYGVPPQRRVACTKHPKESLGRLHIWYSCT